MLSKKKKILKYIYITQGGRQWVRERYEPTEHNSSVARE